MRKKSFQTQSGNEPSEDLIREYAYHLYLQSGQIPGRDLENWLEAKACIAESIPLHRAHARLHRQTNGRPNEDLEVISVPSIDSRNLAP